MCVCACACACACERACVHLCVCSCARASVRMRAYVCGHNVYFGGRMPCIHMVMHERSGYLGERV